jgi:fluoroquinolone transport system permease protein
MRKYLSLLIYEAKTIIRDPINIYMCSFPIFILFLSSYVFPLIIESIDPMKGTMLKLAVLLFIIVILAFGPFFLAAMATFLLLEHKDEHTLNTIAVTPLGADGYLKFKMTYIYLMSVLGMMVILIGTKLLAGGKYEIMGFSFFSKMEIEHIISFSLVNGLFTPALSLLQGAFAKNKVEGFAMIKGSGMLALIPALMVLESFQGKLQYLLGLFPNFWAIKGILVKLMPVAMSSDLSYPMYLLIGALYNMLLLIAAYKLFLRKADF